MSTVEAPATRDGRPGGAERGAEWSRRDFLTLRDYIYSQTGLFLPLQRKPEVQDQVGARIKELGLTGLPQYVQYLRREGREEGELPTLVSNLLQRKSLFFRGASQFEVLEKILLPEAVERRGTTASPTLRIWSAACAKGEEPYSVAILLKELEEDLLRQWKLTVLATEESEEDLDVAKKGRYTTQALESMPMHLRDRYFLEVSPGTWQVKDEIREMVEFETLDLNEKPELGRFDFIFCRDRLSFMDDEDRKKLMWGLMNNLDDEGYLFLGEEESNPGPRRCRMVHFQKAFAFQRDADLMRSSDTWW